MRPTSTPAVVVGKKALDGAWGTHLSHSPRKTNDALVGTLAENANRIATLETRQNGKLIAEMRLQAELVRDWLYYFGGLSDKIEGRVITIECASVLNYTLSEPFGVVAVINYKMTRSTTDAIPETSAVYIATC